jgi:hypothetical protein
MESHGCSGAIKKGSLVPVDIGLLILLLGLIGIPLFMLYEDNKEKPWDLQAILISFLFLAGGYGFYYFLFVFRSM